MASIGLNAASTSSRGALTMASSTSRRSIMSSASLRPRLFSVAPVASTSAPLRTFIRDSASSWSASSASWTSSQSSPPPPSSSTTYGVASQSHIPIPHPLPARVFSNASSNSSSSSFSSTSHPPYSKTFSTTSSLYASHHFDTQAFAQRLEASGISREQADILTEALRDVIDESISNLAKGLVTREEGDQTNYTQKVDFTRLKSELQLLERNDFALMKSENERLMADVEKLKQRLREEITRTTAGVRLDLNLEKGRIRDESAVHALKIKEVDTRIESEIAGLRTSIQSAKFNVLQYLVGVATGAGALLLAYLRMFR
ncbi:related to middle part of C.elegans myosin heavy chain A [Melanopsichium pennsylvanicum]|uniref:Related to middle part of C.elegans myosin heavy chain A n=2 Tax=Melanopsichium pennsylvanicum TaxID=63383 RepID=A0AAJ4XPJ8_9BASI|nr:conserved hypothetical protein [Melanopsichium pennsylvanicum 4]SNX85542.1 related to middle part of C.elegans myosin heavy chain A [Melanopsichium pennsylvanicum]